MRNEADGGRGRATRYLLCGLLRIHAPSGQAALMGGWFVWGYRIDRLGRGPLLSFSLEPAFSTLEGEFYRTVGILGIRQETLVQGLSLQRASTNAHWCVTVVLSVTFRSLSLSLSRGQVYGRGSTVEVVLTIDYFRENQKSKDGGGTW